MGLDNSKDFRQETSVVLRKEIGSWNYWKIITQEKIQGAVVIDLLKNAGFGNITQFKIPTWSECAPGASAAQKKITTRNL